MMEAIDTVLSNGKLLEIFGTPDFTEREGREKQAEITESLLKEQWIREGYELGFHRAMAGSTEREAKLAGMQEGIKAGYSAGKIDGQVTNHKRHGEKMARAKQEGRKEVVEFAKEHPQLTNYWSWQDSPVWQAQLEIWGIR